jgi:hypothetical protein
MNDNRIKINWRLIGVPLAVAVLLLAAFSLASANSQPEVWNQAEPIPIPYMSWSVQCPDQPDSFYLIGGIESGNVTSNKVLLYDAGGNDLWIELAPMHFPLRAAALAC